ncbi:hypothetical protein CLOLEP_03265 [[Clostridium] leptum DSM 753]|uniref:Uncharacterized protein n=1 Tax=[Clostridium] leptum DSM 753 TaxID=428125 RepID=A7VXE0_9FIRM|nr:hypothetical protein CLOLEP_03265 [[Clostridium] leptum DSM 753]
MTRWLRPSGLCRFGRSLVIMRAGFAGKPALRGLSLEASEKSSRRVRNGPAVESRRLVVIG